MTSVCNRIESLSDGDYAGLVSFGLEAMATSGITSITEGRTYSEAVDTLKQTWSQLHEEDGCVINDLRLLDLAMWRYGYKNDCV